MYVKFGWPTGGLEVLTSADGNEWQQSTLPEFVGSSEVSLDDLALVEAVAGEAGILLVLSSGDPEVDPAAPSYVLASTDGLSFVELAIPELPEIVTANPISVASGRAGFAVIVEEAAPDSGPGTWLFVSPDGRAWEPVRVSPAARHLSWVMALGDGWIVRTAGGSHGDNLYPVYVVKPGQEASLRTAPWDFYPQPWGDRVLMHVYAERLVAEHVGEVPSFYATNDARTWWRLPFPSQASPGADEYPAWHVETIASGPGEHLIVLGCGQGCVGMWEFYGDFFAPLMIERDEWTFEIWGDYLIYSNGSELTPVVDASKFYNPDTGVLTVEDDGEIIASITCDDMRQAAREMEWTDESSGLTELPDQALWHSSNGTSWREQSVDDLFGPQSYVFAAAVTYDRALAIVTPNGDRYVADPLGCELGLYPTEQPLEIWIAELP